MGRTSAAFTTTSGLPLSTAESTANAVASSEKGTSSVARSTGRSPEEKTVTSSREILRLSVSMLFRVELPTRRVSRRPVVSAPPVRQNHDEPDCHQGKHEQDEARADEDDQRNHDRRRDRRQCKHLQLVAPDPAKQAFVLLGRNLARVPRAPARLAAPAIAVGDLSRLAAIALDRNRWPAQTKPIVRRGSSTRARAPLKVARAGVTFDGAARVLP